MKNITFSADGGDIDLARLRARQEHTTLNEVFRGWLRRYAKRGRSRAALDDLYAKLEGAKAGRTFTRDELNER